MAAPLLIPYYILCECAILQKIRFKIYKVLAQNKLWDYNIRNYSGRSSVDSLKGLDSEQLHHKYNIKGGLLNEDGRQISNTRIFEDQTVKR